MGLEDNSVKLYQKLLFLESIRELNFFISKNIYYIKYTNNNVEVLDNYIKYF